MIPVTIVVEGDTDVPFARKILRLAGLAPGDVHDKGGKGSIDKRLKGYLAAGRHSPWLVLRDLDHDAECAPSLLSKLVMTEDSSICLRVPVRSMEAWLLADGDRVASFFGVRPSVVPTSPDGEADPKRTLVHLAAQSRKVPIRKGMVPKTGAVRRVGPAYETLMIEFGEEHWRPSVARRFSPSLDRCIRSLQRAKGGPWKRWCG